MDVTTFKYCFFVNMKIEKKSILFDYKSFSNLHNKLLLHDAFTTLFVYWTLQLQLNFNKNHIKYTKKKIHESANYSYYNFLVSVHFISFLLVTLDANKFSCLSDTRALIMPQSWGLICCFIVSLVNSLKQKTQ